MSNNETVGSETEPQTEPVVAPVFNGPCEHSEADKRVIAQGNHEEDDNSVTTYAEWECLICGHLCVENTYGQPIPDPVEIVTYVPVEETP